MALKTRIEDEMKAALISGNRFLGETLRNLKAAILNEEVAKNVREQGLGDDDVEKVIAREVKKRDESAKIYRDNGRPELAEPEEKEAEILRGYLPEQMSEADLTNIIERIMAESGASGASAMGQVIGMVKKEVGNSADGSLIAKIVKEKLK